MPTPSVPDPSTASWRGEPARAAWYGLGISLASVLWLVALHAIEGGSALGRQPLVVDWLRDAALAFPVAFIAAGFALRLAAGIPAGRRARWEPIVVAGVVNALIVAVLPLHRAIFGAVDSAAGVPAHLVHQQSEAPPLPVHMLHQWLVAFAVSVFVAVAVHGLVTIPRDRRAGVLRRCLPPAAVAVAAGIAVTTWLLALHLVARDSEVVAATLAMRTVRDGLLTTPLVALGGVALVLGLRRNDWSGGMRAAGIATATAVATGLLIGFAGPATERMLEVFRHGSHPLVSDASLVVLPGSSGRSLAAHVLDHALAVAPLLVAIALLTAWLGARRVRPRAASRAAPHRAALPSAPATEAIHPGSPLVMPTMTRRELVRAGLVTGVALSVPLGAATARAGVAASPRFTPFTRRLTFGDPITPTAPFATQVGGRPEWGAPKYYEITMREADTEIIPGFLTPIYGYDGIYPGPTFRVREGQPAIVRFRNALRVPNVVHNHGGHQAGKFAGDTVGDSDSFPDDFIRPGTYKDYFYPHIAPDGDLINADFTSTQWYHDHAVDITGPNVYAGLAGFYLLTDALEDSLIARGVIPDANHDLPLAIQDRRFDSRGRLVYDTADFDGALGDVYVVNGKAQPYVEVERRKYRLRLLNGANARYFHLRMSNGAAFLQIGTDSWLLPAAVRRPFVDLAMAQRADVIVDFRTAPSEVFLMDLMRQDDPRRPGEVRAPGVPILKFVVKNGPAQDNASAAPGTVLRPHTPIGPDEIVATRRFRFDRSGGRWTINGREFDHDRDDARPRLGTAERWILENNSGGWAHPVHIHLEAHHVERLNGRAPQPWLAFNSDTTLLGRNGSAQVVMRFRTFPGRFVFHCHNIEHEDMRMMGAFNVLR